MDRYGIEPDHGETIFLEEEPLMETSEFELLSRLSAEADAEEEEDDC